jgi:hypothetical protein
LPAKLVAAGAKSGIKQFWGKTIDSVSRPGYASIRRSSSARSGSVMFLSGGVKVNEDFCPVIGPAFHRFTVVELRGT